MSTELATTFNKLADQIAEHHASCVRAANNALMHAKEAGRLLSEAKAILPHGKFGAWIDEHFEGSCRTAQAYMRVHKNWKAIEAKSADSALLSLDSALRLIRSPRASTDDEQAIVEGLPQFMQVSHALRVIRDGRLYRETHESFEKFCLEEFGLDADLIQLAMEFSKYELSEAGI